jgi:hypothetical protein
LKSYPLLAPMCHLSSSWPHSHVMSCASELEDTPHTGRRQAAKFLVQILLLPLLCWTGSERSHVALHMYKYHEVLYVQHYVGAPVLSHWRHGAVAPWRCHIKIFTNLRSAKSSSSSTLVQEHNPCVQSIRVCIRVSVNCYIVTR